MDWKSKIDDEREQSDTRSSVAADELYRALSQQTSRRTLAYLLDVGESSVDELADVLCGWESESGVVTSERHERIRAALHHQHLPELDAVGVVTYHPGDGNVELVAVDAQTRALLQQSLEYNPK